LLMPGVKVGDGSWVGPNVVVDRDLPANSIMLLKQSTEKRALKP
jgi:acetyltransferase-like isoleucine patch superfamily enzyme